jgi:hypothetical protein
MIKQALIADSIKFFKKDFLQKWNLKEYYDSTQPCVFFGGKELSAHIHEHTGFKLILPSVPNDIPNFNIVKNIKDMYIIGAINPNIPSEIVCKDLLVQIKDYSLFTPTTLGNKIYTYSGFKNGYDLYKKNIKSIHEIEKKTGFEIITTSHKELKDYHDIEYLKATYYDRSFVNLNLSRDGNHLTTAIELGMMGRKTIMKKNYQNFSFMIDYTDLENIISIIKEESKKIGTVQPCITSDIISTDEWLNTKYWINLKN